MKMATWNLDRPVSDKRRKAARAEIDKIAPDILVLTETHDGFNPGLQFSESSAGGRDGVGRYKSDDHHWVTIWSNYPLEKLSTEDEKRTVAVRVSPSEGAPFLVYGTVLPWTGSEWHGHPSDGGVAFGEALKVQVSDWKKLQHEHPEDELFVLGDFNQDLADTRYCGTKVTRDLLSEALKNCGLVAITAGDGDPVRRELKDFACIDHICALNNSCWSTEGTERWPNTPKPEKWLSDHFGVAVSLVPNIGQ